MSVPIDILQAKQNISARLLRNGLRGGVVGMRRTLSIREAVTSAGQNVHAVGVGRKIVDGKVTQQTCVRIYVVQKLASSALPPRAQLPTQIDGIPTDVIASSPAFLLRKTGASSKASRTRPKGIVSTGLACTEQRRKRQRPVIAGISTAHLDVTAGTLSCFCRSTRHGDDPHQVYALSNNHVFANVNQSQVGDDLYQPGPADGGTSSDHFAELHRFVRINLGGTTPNRVDAAIGGLLAGVEFRPEICGIGKLTGTAQAVEDMTVRKHGRTTGYTEGAVTDESLDALVGMDHNDPEVVALFENQMRIDRLPSFPFFGRGGDSGSLIVNKSKAEAVGLYFAGPDSGTYGIANHIADVLTELQIELL